MGIEKIVFHSAKCDKCNKWLSEYKGDILKIRPNRTIASSLAKESGFIRIGANIWLCPECASEFKQTYSECNVGFKN